MCYMLIMHKVLIIEKYMCLMSLYFQNGKLSHIRDAVAVGNSTEEFVEILLRDSINIDALDEVDIIYYQSLPSC